MMNYIWGFMLLIGILFALANNSAAGFTDGLMSSCTDAVEFIISLAGVMAVWSGLMKIAERSGLITVISRAISPLMAYLFPEEKNGHSAAASNTMCMFIALSMSMIQLVPVTVIKVRSDLGSASPESIIIPSIAAGLVSMIASVWVCKFYERKETHV